MLARPDWVSKYNNIPFLEKGRSMAGVDCWGLAHIIFKQELNILTPDYLEAIPNPFDTDIVPPAMRAGLVREFKQRDKDDKPQAFDLVCFNVYGRLMHCGVMVNQRDFIHSCNENPTAVESLDTHRWHNRIEGFYYHV